MQYVTRSTTLPPCKPLVSTSTSLLLLNSAPNCAVGVSDPRGSLVNSWFAFALAVVRRLNNSAANYPGGLLQLHAAGEQMPPLLSSATCDLCLTYVVARPRYFRLGRGNDFVSFLPSYPGTETKERFFDYDLVTKAEISRLPYDSNCTGASASEERERPLPLRRSLLHFGLFHCPPPCSFSDDIPCLPEL